MKHKTPTLLLALIAMAMTTQAQSILLDFGQFAKRHSLGVPDVNGNYWSYVTGNADIIADLTGADGNPTGIGLAVASFTGPGSYNDGLIPNAALGDFAFAAVTDDALFFTADLTPTVILSGLNDTLTYDLSFYGARVTTITRTTTYAVGASSMTLTTSGTGIASNGGNWNDNTVAILSGLVPSSGTITVNLSATGGFGYLNAMEVTAVPEPAAFAALLGLVGLVFVAVRHRRA